jgi:hypothetical protein
MGHYFRLKIFDKQFNPELNFWSLEQRKAYCRTRIIIKDWTEHTIIFDH